VHVHFELLTQKYACAVASIDSQVLFHIEACSDVSASNDNDGIAQLTAAAAAAAAAVALALAREIRASGMRCGVVLSPATSVAAILPLLRLVNHMTCKHAI
jgi:pentose-5-phosphate-3-epimerase